jgi:hypothetical protein
MINDSSNKKLTFIRGPSFELLGKENTELKFASMLLSQTPEYERQ